ncbi:hypothetical protein Y032_0059g3070 [Ancylostoma ceylanicum]|uniref:Uncharacterized protein n=1 Tax=Ancylostoma ceylanicum TaxID=53326 RepID=A0A016U5C7_9BILA|nr:hypothetical protein Y032_0059g3070 [Ancylostoma ceylanicum]
MAVHISSRMATATMYPSPVRSSCVPNGDLSKLSCKMFPNACAPSAAALDGCRRTFASATHPHASAAQHLVWPIVALGHNFIRASAGQTSPTELAESPAERRHGDPIGVA